MIYLYVCKETKDNSLPIVIIKNLKSLLNKDLSQIGSLGIAVSGGSDSTYLLNTMAQVAKLENIKLKVVTVDHNIRFNSNLDAQFVANMCEHLKNNGVDIECTVKTIPTGLVNKIAKIRGCGEEDAARFLRYEAFKEFAVNQNVRYLLLAHNKNDTLETALIHFLQGVTLTAIKSTRDIKLTNKGTLTIIRPMLDIDKTEILKYLKINNIPFCTDITNESQKYLRNKIRLNLVPLLNKKFASWDTAILNGAKRAAMDDDYFENECKKIIPLKNTNENIEYSREAIKNLHISISSRVILNSIGIIKNNIRFPHNLVIDVLQKLSNRDNYDISSNGVKIGFNKDIFFIALINNNKNNPKKIFYNALISKSGRYELPFGTIDVTTKQNIATVQFYCKTNTKLNKINNSYDNSSDKCLMLNLTLPFCIRNIHTGDLIKMSNGKHKSMAKLLSELAIDIANRSITPIIEDYSMGRGRVVAVVGSVFKAKDFVLTR